MPIQAAHYAETVARLQQDFVIQMMAADLVRNPLTELAHEDGTPRWEFTMVANREYRTRADRARACGHGDDVLFPASAPRHIGAVAEALLAYRAEVFASIRMLTKQPDTTPEAEVIAAFDALVKRLDEEHKAAQGLD